MSRSQFIYHRQYLKRGKKWFAFVKPPLTVKFAQNSVNTYCADRAYYNFAFANVDKTGYLPLGSIRPLRSDPNIPFYNWETQ